MKNNEYYKLMQLTDVLVNTYGYTQILLKEYQSLIQQEAWFLNENDDNYQVIRVTFKPASAFVYEKHVNDYVKNLNNKFKDKELKILDIHISNDNYDANNEPFDYLNIEENFFNGVDVSKIYPLIYTAIQYKDDPDDVISNVMKKLKATAKNRFRKLPLKKKYPNYVTTIVMIICILNYLLSLYLKYKYNDVSAVYVALGADYKTFTLGFKQCYRLITYGFVHADIIHLLCNLVSLKSIGGYVESKYGHFKYSIILLFTTIVGSLTQEILSDNGICLGISGAIYGLLVIFMIDIIKTRIIDIRRLIPTIFVNLFLNFLTTTAWMAHLGGAIAGLAIYYCFDNLKDYPRIILCLVLFVGLLIKFLSISSISEFYAGTDFNILDIYKNFGFNDYYNKMLIKLINVYSKFGG